MVVRRLGRHRKNDMGMMPNCKEMTELASAAMEREPPMVRRLLMAIHRLLCPNCKAAHHQLRLIHEAAGRFDDFCSLDDPDRALPPEVAERIKTLLKCPSGESG